MNVLFLTILNINSIEERNIYTDLLRKFRDDGHNVTIVCPTERRFKKNTHLISENGVEILKIKTLNIQKANLIEKGLGTLLLEYQFLNGIKNYLKGNKYDVLIYSTPPITFSKVIEYFKKQGKVFTYLLLKDIFPQNAVDLNMLKKNGLLHRYFIKKEKKLYNISDKIGCMSPANVQFIAKNHPEIKHKLEVNPNSVELLENYSINIKVIREKYHIPTNRTVFVYGGNLGKPQGIDFLLEIINEAKVEVNNAFFLIIGNGTEFSKIYDWFEKHKPENAKLIEFLPKKDYDDLVKSSDVGMIFLNPNFTIPNFPSRLLTYLEYSLPVFSATDTNTDISTIIEDNKIGYSVKSGDLKSSICKIKELTENSELRIQMGKNANVFLRENYDVNISYKLIIKEINV